MRPADFATAKIIDPLCDCIWEIGIHLHIVEELGVTLPIDGPCLVRHIGCGLTLLPAPAVDNEKLVVDLGADGPEPDDREKAFGFGPTVSFEKSNCVCLGQLARQSSTLPGKPLFVPSPAIRFAERAEGVKGPKR